MKPEWVKRLRNCLAYQLIMVWPIRQDMPRWLYKLELMLLPYAGSWAFRGE